LLDGLPVGILAETVDRTVLAVNEELLSMFGLPDERVDVIGRDCVRLAEAASDGFVDASAFVHGIQSCIDDGDPVLGELLERTDGRVFERSYLPVELPTGRGHLWMYEDVTAEQIRKAELETYERLVEVAPVGVFRTTTDGRVLTTNQRLATILGYEDEADLIENYENLARDLYVDPNRREAFLERLQAETVVEDFEYEARIRDGGRRWLSMNARLLEETDDGSRVITGFTWDLTERKRHERQLAVLGRILRHNLRNTLTVVEGQTELLAAETTDRNGAKERILDRTGKLLELADKEREIVALLRGKTEFVTRDLRVLAEEACADVRAEHPAATITVSGPESAPVSVCTGFERAIRELVENAVTHAEDGDPTVSLSISVDGGTTDIEVEDDGPGIPEVERRILRGQADESPLVHSTGIGLFLVHQLVHVSNGSLFFETNEPRGSVVRLRLQSA
jgi:PAS domain S-box-containing protein